MAQGPRAITASVPLANGRASPRRPRGIESDNALWRLRGDTYSGPRAAGGTRMRSMPAEWDRVYWEGKHLLMSLLDIEVPMISAINGPAWRHSEIPLLCDIVLAADDVQFQDSAHFPRRWSWARSTSCSLAPIYSRAPGRWPSSSRSNPRSSSATRECCLPSRSSDSCSTTWATASHWKA